MRGTGPVWDNSGSRVARSKCGGLALRDYLMMERGTAAVFPNDGGRLPSVFHACVQSDHKKGRDAM